MELATEMEGAMITLESASAISDSMGIFVNVSEFKNDTNQQ